MNDKDSRSGLTGRPARVSTADGAPEGWRAPEFTDLGEDYEESERDTDYIPVYEGESEEECLESQDDGNPAISCGNRRVLDGASGVAGSRAIEAKKNSRGAADAAGMGYHDSGVDNEEFVVARRESAHGWPPGLIIVGLVALALLVAGGYAVMQQRSATREEIRHLQAALVTAAGPEVAADSEALQGMEQETAEILATIHVLNLYNERLTDQVAGLEKQLAARQAAPAGISEPEQAATTETTAELSPRPAAEHETTEIASDRTNVVSAGEGDWFVNFSSHNQRIAAENWVKKLRPLAGKAIVVHANKDGKTIYRVRVVGLADRSQAGNVADQLQSDHDMPPLWVGTD